jgi:hypothetical protein
VEVHRGRGDLVNVTIFAGVIPSARDATAGMSATQWSGRPASSTSIRLELSS